MGGAFCASAAPLAEGSKHRCAHRLLRVHIPAPACYACLCPHLWMATHGPPCPLFSPRLLHSEVLWTGRHSNLFVTLPAPLARGCPRWGHGHLRCPPYCRVRLPPWHSMVESGYTHVGLLSPAGVASCPRTRHAGQPEMLPQGRSRVCAPEQPAALQFRDHEIDELGEGPGE